MGPELVGHGVQGAAVDRLGSVEADPPGGQISRLAAQAAGDQAPTEVWGGGDGGPDMGGPLEPAAGMQQELGGCHQVKREAHQDGAEHGPDQTHVVVERQPAQAHVRRTQLQAGGHAPGTGHDGTVRDHGTTRTAHAAAGKLQEGCLFGRGRNVFAIGMSGGCRDARNAEGQGEGGRGQDQPRVRSLDQGLQLRHGFGRGSQRSRPGQWHRRRSGQQDAEEGGDEMLVVGQDQGNAVAWLQACGAAGGPPASRQDHDLMARQDALLAPLDCGQPRTRPLLETRQGLGQGADGGREQWRPGELQGEDLSGGASAMGVVG